MSTTTEYKGQLMRTRTLSPTGFHARLRGLGLVVRDCTLPRLSLLVLRLFSWLPAFVKENLLFRPTRFCLSLQKALQRCVGGPAMVRTQFISGPLKGCFFECLTSEKYFLLGRDYELSLQILLHNVVRPGSIVYDIGAHVGHWALLFSSLCGLDGRVFAFEPVPQNFARLQRNIDLNKRVNVTALPFAVSDTESVALLAEQGSMSRVVSSPSRPGEHYAEVQTRSLDDLVFRDLCDAPHLIKLDVEGYAGTCLEGARRILDLGHPWVLIEIHNHLEANKVSAILADYGYELLDIEATSKFPRHILAIPHWQKSAAAWRSGECVSGPFEEAYT